MVEPPISSNRMASRSRSRSPVRNPDIPNKFYLRYYVGHTGRFGHEFLEFELRSDGRLRYANNSNYKSDLMIRKEVYVSKLIVDEFEKIVKESDMVGESDKRWPESGGKNGTQELEVVLPSVSGDNGTEFFFSTSKLGSMSEVANSKDPKGLEKFYYLIQDLKCFIFSLINIHFRVRPV